MCNLFLVFIHFHADVMAEFHHPRDPYFPNQGNSGRLEEPEVEPEENPGGGPAMGQEVGPEVEPEEYVVTDYEYDESDQEIDEAKDVEEERSEPYLSKAPSNPHTVQKGKRLRGLSGD